MIVIIDEAGQVKELEVLLAVVHSIESVKLVVLEGDPKQLPPIVMSKQVKRENSKVMSIFAEQVALSFMARQFEANYDLFVLDEQHHIAKALSDIY